MPKPEWFIYTLADPRTPDIIRYVGKTKDLDARYRDHCAALGRTKKNNHRIAWLRSLLKQGIRPELKVLHGGIESDWRRAERAWIAVYRAAGYPLVNTTDGGEGTPGLTPTEDHRQVLRDSHTGQARSVTVIETGVQFESISAAARAFNCTMNNLMSSIRNGHKARGLHWRYTDGEAPTPAKEYRRPVKCIETGEEFQSLAAAAASVSRSASNIQQAIKDVRPCGTLHWEYV